jgi:hypothetical protein
MSLDELKRLNERIKLGRELTERFMTKLKSLPVFAECGIIFKEDFSFSFGGHDFCFKYSRNTSSPLPYPNYIFLYKVVDGVESRYGDSYFYFNDTADVGAIVQYQSYRGKVDFSPENFDATSASIVLGDFWISIQKEKVFY